MKINGMLIDVDSSPGKVKELELEEEELDEFYEALNCRCFDIVTRKIGGKAFNIVCDDEGLFREDCSVSAVAGNGTVMLVGNLFICNNYHEHLTSLSKEDISHIVKHIAIASVLKYEDIAKAGEKKIHTHPILTEVEYV